jgi:tetratricopeptide (TPR) repeat protein
LSTLSSLTLLASASGQSHLLPRSSGRDHDVEATALGTIGAACINHGDPDGLADVERCAALLEEQGTSHVVGWHLNLVYARSVLGDPPGSFAARQAAWGAAERYGSVADLRYIELERVAEHYWTGRWDQALHAVEQVVAEAAAGGREYLEGDCRLCRGRIRLARGEADAALEDATRALALARESGDAQNLDPALTFGAPGAAHRRPPRRGARTRRRAPHQPPGAGAEARPWQRPAGRPRPARALGREAGPGTAIALAAAARAYLAGNHIRAAEVYAEIGARPDEAYARLQAARGLLAVGQPTRGRPPCSPPRLRAAQPGCGTLRAALGRVAPAHGVTSTLGRWGGGRRLVHVWSTRHRVRAVHSGMQRYIILAGPGCDPADTRPGAER